ncbi:hypothetical protein [Bacillus dakarensis]|uniref:hypothetical protein n=1 Tax=Robertmurraya dakarensis TaxID=1926278 RepID=UPI003B012EDF
MRNYMARGSQIASKVVVFMAHILSEENLSESSTLDSEVLKSTLCYHRIDLIPKINAFWGVNWASLAPNLVCYSWNNSRIDY